MATHTPPPVLEVRNVSVRFGGVAALTDVSMAVWPGEVVALVGDNGAGKSTLVKTISGIQQPDAGEIIVAGRTHAMKGPQDAAAAGIQTVYQDLALCDNLDTVQNLFLGREICLPGGRVAAWTAPEWKSVPARCCPTWTSRSAIRGSLQLAFGRAAAIGGDLPLDPGQPAGGSAGRADRRAWRGAAQAGAGADRAAQGAGRAVVIISHDIGDVQQIADRVVVLRLGRKVAEVTRGGYSRDELIAAMTGALDAAELAALRKELAHG